MVWKKWTVADWKYLEENWGKVSIKNIARRLGRSVNAVKMKAQKHGLKDPRFAGHYITLNQLASAVGRCYQVVKTWYKLHGLPAKPKVFCKRAKVLVIQIDDFWEWARENIGKMNFALIEPGILGPEPEWVKEKRAADLKRSQKTARAVDWTPTEDQRLAQLVRIDDMTYPKLAEAFNRSEAAIKRRLYDLDIKFRPVRLNNHIKYKPEEVRLLVEMAEAGYSFDTIARKIGKSALGVRGKLERMRFDFRKRRLPNDMYREVFGL